MHFSYYNILELFGLSEIILFLAKRSKNSGAKKQHDKSSLLLLWIAIPACLTAAIIVSSYNLYLFGNQAIAADLGIALAILGFIIRWIAIVQLGKMFTVDVSIAAKHTLKSDGLYEKMRHPSYTGLILIFTGLVISMGSLLGCVFLIPFYVAINYRIVVEEKALITEFGDQYIAYQKNTARLIPGIY